MEYIEIKEQIKQKLPVARDLGDSENLLELGLSSLTIMRLVNQWRKQGVKVSFGSLMENPTLEGWWALIQRSMKKKAGKKRAQESKITPEKDMKQPFPLTDVQYAYWVGRDEEQALGGIDCHAYLEFDGGNIDPERLEKAWNVLQYHHPMLRACFLEDGTQKILDKPYCEKIKVHDFSRMSSEEAEVMAVSIRERLSHRKLKIEEGEVAGIELTLFPENRARMHVDMALLVADVQSLQILLRDLAAAYRGESLPAESKGWNFASYLERQKEEDKEERNNAEGYWKKRLEHLPKGPGLPLAKRPQEVTKTVFNRRIVRIGKEEWAHLQVRAKEYQTTPAMVLLTAYATVLERWSRNHRFLINIPFFNRKTEQQGLEDVIADFTTLLLLEIDCEGNPTFAELLDRIQKQLHEDMKYTAYSGVQVQRDLAQMYGDASAVAPVVFACNLGTPLVNDTFRKELGQFSYMISQTPQVWNDFQSYEDENGVQLTWDSVDKLFPENMIPDMLECFENLLHELGKKDWNQRFDVLPEKRKREIEDTARTGVPERVECLHWAVMNHAEVCPEDIALIDAGSGRSVSYGELKARATAVAAGISEKDIKGVPVALTLPRGIEQIEAALGILLSGNSYLSVSLSQPKDRRALIHEKTGVRYVVTNRELSEKLDWPEGTEILVMEGMEEGQENVRLPEVSPKDSAYIIMTSGSTGVPKGVEIAHESAWNTVQDINEKYHVTSADRALAVSAMDFDLSVYDVFGILGAGGTLVLLPEQERRNADYWLEQVLKYQITVWNSVPVLLDMLLIRAESMKQKLPIRAVMLSGDWIGMDLPQRVAAWTEDCQFVAMGGATEASIWSNYQNVTLPMPKNWKSIPYGKPLRYQAYRVVDEYGRDCPYWAEGELWIGGFGVAKGYRGDSALTGQKFITDQYGRWYRTGDLGRIWDDETIEFLGRKDHQVKIRGHRIELGEIEHAIQEFPGVAHAVVDTVSDGHGNKTLAAYIGAPIQEDSKVTTYLYGTDIFGRGWKELKDDVSKCAISFRNYVLNEMGMKNSSRYRRDKEYWKNRLDIIPEAPVLPMRSNAEKSNKFIRMARKLSAEDWEKIKFFSSQNSVTPTATVLSIFALCIERWSVNKKFSLNLTTLIRNNKYTGIYNTIGDFTSVDVLEIDLSEKIIFADFVKNVNKQIFEDLDHSSYSGIEVIRDLRKRRKNPMLLFPIIFTSSIGLIKNDGMVGKVNNNGISQTPQAFLDCQVMDNEEGLFINWDIRNGIFEEGVIQDIFCTFLTYLKKISESVEFWNQQANVELPEKQMDQRKNVNSTFKEIKMDTLQNLFLKSALEMPKKTAVVDECGEHTYEELLWTAYGIADELQKCSCKAGDYVGIKLNKSFFQIASVLGTLLIGAAFVPIDNDQPEIRADKILEIAKIKCLIGEKEETHKYREKYKWIDKDSVILKKSYDEIVNDNFDDVAYVIFTSGSTGEPKGVVIEQQAVVNTIIDINERFQVKDKDSILALSQLHFDLSVYDIFGMLATGGTIVIPEKVRYKDPSYWLMLVEKWNITVWNSVPAFMEMFVDYLERFYKGEKLSINKILLSGDWIPVKLPEKICRFLKDVRIYSLGGATEASIWSIYHECKMGESYNSSCKIAGERNRSK